MSVTRSLTRHAIHALALAALAATTAAAQTSLTIYNDGRVLVRRTVPVRVASGFSTLTVPLGMLDPSTLFSLDPAVNVVRAAYDGAVDEASVLRRAVGRRITFRIPRSRPDGSVLNDTLSAVVLSADPLQFQLPDGRVTFSMPGQPLYPADLVVSVPSAALTLQSSAARDNLRVGYFTQGARWLASYQVVLGGNGATGDARVTGAAVVSSETLRADSAEVQLLAGSVNMAAPPYAPSPLRGRVAMQAMAKDEVSQVAEQRVGEFHLYSVPERLTLLPGLTSSAAMFDPASVRYERNYVVHGQLPIWGYCAGRGQLHAQAAAEDRLRRPAAAGRRRAALPGRQRRPAPAGGRGVHRPHPRG